MKKIYSSAELQPIVDKYNIGSIQDLRLFTSGSDNSNYYLKTDKGEYVFKIYDGVNLTPDNVLFELKVMELSCKAGIKTPRVLYTANNLNHVLIDNLPSVILEFIPGENMRMKELSDTVASELGDQIGKMDKALSVLADEKKTRHNYIFDLQHFLENESSIKLLPELSDRKIFQDIIDEFKIQQKRINELPTGIIHNDLALQNILVLDNHLSGILDFSDIAYNPYIQNLATAMSQTFFTYNWKPSQARLFLESYTKHRPLSVEEKDLLFLITKARFLTLVIEFNRYNVETGGDEVTREFATANHKFLKDFLLFGKERFDELIP